MSLLPLQKFEPVFSTFAEKKVGFIQAPGNAGDHLIQAATFQLFSHFGIAWTELPYFDPVMEGVDADIIALSGGGSMGDLWGQAPFRAKIVACAAAAGKNLVILPSSFTSGTSERFSKVFVRELSSKELYSGSILAPDLALGYTLERSYPQPDRDLGLFLRKDIEARFARYSPEDPANVCKTYQEYLMLASHFHHIVTDRLHFAICGLLLHRRTTLLPNSYHKNRAMWECWLRQLGCEWWDNVDPINHGSGRS